MTSVRVLRDEAIEGDTKRDKIAKDPLIDKYQTGRAYIMKMTGHVNWEKNLWRIVQLVLEKMTLADPIYVAYNKKKEKPTNPKQAFWFLIFVLFSTPFYSNSLWL